MISSQKTKVSVHEGDTDSNSEEYNSNESMESFSDEEDMEVSNNIHSNSMENIPSKGLANVMKSILGKQTSKKIILAKGRTDKEIVLKKLQKRKPTDGLEKVLEDKDSGTVSFLKTKKVKRQSDEESTDNDLNVREDANAQRERYLKKKAWADMGRIKPTILDREKEKTLQRIATKGVVQLFNAVKQQQAMVNEMVEEAGPSERRKEKALKSISKGQFLDILKGTSNTLTASGKENSKKDKKRKEKNTDTSSSDAKEKPSWSILRDDFMMGAKMKDWDKDSDNEQDNGSLNGHSDDNEIET